MEPAGDEGPPVPVDTNFSRLQPDASGIGDGNAVDSEVVEQIAVQALHIKPAKAAEFLAVDQGGYPLPSGIRQEIHPSADRDDDKQSGKDGRRDTAEECEGLQSRTRLRYGLDGRIRSVVGRRGGIGQNAWPMLT